MLRALGIIFLVLLVMLMAVGGGFLSHFLTNINSEQHQSPEILRMNQTVSADALHTNQQPAPLPFPQAKPLQAAPQRQVNRAPFNAPQNPASQHPATLQQVNAVASTSTPAMLAPAVAVFADSDTTFEIVKVESGTAIIWDAKDLIQNGKKQVLVKSGGELKIYIKKVNEADFTTQSYTCKLQLESNPGTTINSTLTRPDNKTLIATFTSTASNTPGPYHLVFSDSTPAPWTEKDVATNIIIPNVNLRPTIKNVSVHKYGSVSDNFDPTVSYGVYDGYLRVDISSANGKENFVYVDSNGVFIKYIPIIRSQRFINSNNVWQYELKIPSDTQFPGKIYALLQQDGAHAYSTEGILVNEQSYNRDQVSINSESLVNDTSGTELNKQGDYNYFKDDGTFKIKLNINNGANGGNLDGAQLVVFDSNGKFLGQIIVPNSASSIELPISLPNVGKYTLIPTFMQGDQKLSNIQMKPIKISIADQGPLKGVVDASSFNQVASEDEFTISFDKNYPLDKSTLKANISVTKDGGDSTNLEINETDGITYLQDKNAIQIKLDNASSAGVYKIAIATGATDLHGITLAGSYDIPKLVASGDIASGSTGNYVPYREYTDPRENPLGFNPSDKVVTRIARLYYFRDAHRVAQIINRKIRSYNRHGVDMKSQLAGEALKLAEAATDLRKQNEKSAINAAVKARQAETKLEDLQQSLARRSNETQQIKRDIQDMEADLNRKRFLESRDYDKLPNVSLEQKQKEQAELEELKDQISEENTDEQLQRAKLSLTTAQNDSTLTRSKINLALAAVETARSEELRLNDEWEVTQRKEERAYAEEFRKRVAAAHEDPDSYAEGLPDSDDPVEQVSLSVIGTGLIQLRGPLKGVNEVRTMINQIDAPVGQVRIALHTVQINGEHGDRMEKVALKIQRYIDHSRFLTTQSAQMLRNSVVKVASQKAAEVDAMCPDHSQHARDLKYVEAFFGADFLEALYELDSEFLKTGNKLLSLNSMDSTSLSSALFLMALAKNSVRMEILADFQMQIESQLPQDEQDYFVASGMVKKHDFKKFHFLAQNAKFVSLRGFFNADVIGDDTLNPLQREFIRLAQIFKSRLVTEIELKERILERSLIEDRIGDYHKMMKDTREDEEKARESVQTAKKIRLEELFNLTNEFSEMLQVLSQDVKAQLSDSLPSINSNDRDNEELYLKNEKTYTVNFADNEFTYRVVEANNPKNGAKWVVDSITCNNAAKPLSTSTKCDEKWNQMIQQSTNEFQRLHEICNKFRFLDSQHQEILITENKFYERFVTNYCETKSNLLKVKEDSLKNAKVILTLTIGQREYSKLIEAIQTQTRKYVTQGELILANLTTSKSSLQEAYLTWIRLREQFLSQYQDKKLKATAECEVQDVNKSFRNLFEAQLKEETALALLEGSRRPLDHKKFLDMLVDDVEEKFIELVEGTRAHTANIDNYMQRIATALEDDFNTQFYNPAFRYVREASRYWDVSFAQVETTTILTNNRQFARVAPQATMEFDLPKRDILINEAFESALAAYSDYGALMNDPNFLSLAKLYGGQPASETYSADGTSPRIRSVLPGTPSVMDEEFLSQGASGPPKFGSQLEALIPDPSVYKFETGTAFEIRPVIQPDGQAVIFHLNYIYTTNIREPIRADEKHLGRVKQHFIDTDVQTGNYELREVSRYQVALKASRTSRGVPLLEDVPGLGVLFRPLPQAESSLQENIIMAQSVIYPTLFDIMGLRWAPSIADLDTITLRDMEFVTRNRQRVLRNKVSDFASGQVDGFLDVPEKERRADLYRTQRTIPYNHPSGYTGPGLNLKDSTLQEGYRPQDIRPPSRYIPGKDPAFVPGATEQWAPSAEGPYVPLLEQNRQQQIQEEDSALLRKHKSRSSNLPRIQNTKRYSTSPPDRNSGSPVSEKGYAPPAPAAPGTPILFTPAPEPTTSTKHRKSFNERIKPTSFEEKKASHKFKIPSPLNALKKLNFMNSEPKQNTNYVRPISYEKPSVPHKESQQNLFGIPSIVRPQRAQPRSTQTQTSPKSHSMWSRFSVKLPGLYRSKK